MNTDVFSVGARVIKNSDGYAGGKPVGSIGTVESVNADDIDIIWRRYSVRFDGADGTEQCFNSEIDLYVEPAFPKRAYIVDGVRAEVGDHVSRQQRSHNGASTQHGVIVEVFDNEAAGMVGVRWGQRQDVDCVRLETLTFEGRGTVEPMTTVALEGNIRHPHPSRLPDPTAHSGLDPVTKDTNPKDALAGFKPRWFSFLPLQVLIGVGKAMFEGGWKYGKHNYRQSGVRASVYVDAAVCGHLMPWMEGEECDENGMNHIEKAIASLMVLRDSQINGNWIDDRPLAAKNFGAHMAAETAHFQEMKVALKEKFGDPVAPYTEANRDQPR